MNMIFNHDGFGLLAELAGTDGTPADADRVLVAPLAWLEEGLLDGMIPATHNHEPDPYDWIPEAFFAAAKRSPRPCAVWPQLWPTPEPWNSGHNQRHAPEAVQQRCAALGPPERMAPISSTSAATDRWAGSCRGQPEAMLAVSFPRQ